ncbi:MAG: Uroporphyrin-III C/tetrapyrrole (Corrin/Porphyrin) methyltransferase [Candidatus Midichloriaceae bacterium]|jgi:16S rRNA (cytidine1402-2'-O)-methyltransferase|nr:Uroporphyrin-III C/tetrapyrrole (Corrin/Porphyrin) methyltransferase [Candidatus Midichloriaceae bacterium]
MSKTYEVTTGELFIVATPIGNLQDITYNAVNVLSKVDLILCENTKNSSKLLSFYGINTKVKPYNDHSDERDREKIISQLLSGKNIALISDAGTPLISDPGFKLVASARKMGIKVRPIPGATAFTAAICASGMATDRFLFCGFLPTQKSKLEADLQNLKAHKFTLIFYESPKRIIATINAIFEIMGDREIVVAREITKIHEEFITCKCSEFLNTHSTREFKGEIVLMVAGAEEIPEDIERVKDILSNLLKNHSVKDAVNIGCEMTSLSRKELYNIALKLNYTSRK